jgi:hypothetical protein
MEIKRGVIYGYLDRVTDYIADTGGEPDDITGYHDYVISMRNNAAYDGNLDILLIAIDCLLVNPDLDAPSFATRNVIFDVDEMHELLKYVRSVAFPNEPQTSFKILNNVKFVGGIIFDAEIKLHSPPVERR